MSDPKPVVSLTHPQIDEAIKQYVERLYPQLSVESVDIKLPTVSELDSGDNTVSAQVVVLPKKES